MTERKPSGVGFESWTERHIREAAERGEFDRLSGAGQPIRGLGRPYDEMWWIKEKLARENLSYLPPTLALRKEVQEELATAARAGTEAEVRRIVAGINGRISEASRTPLSGPPLDLVPFDVERIVQEWRDGHAGSRIREMRDGVGGQEDRSAHAIRSEGPEQKLGPAGEPSACQRPTATGIRSIVRSILNVSSAWARRSAVSAASGVAPWAKTKPR